MPPPSLRNPIIRLFQDEHKRMIFIFCLVLSSVFWMLSKLSRTYTVTIDLPIRYENLPDDRIWLLDESPRIVLEVEAYGFALVGYRYRNRNSLVLDLDQIGLRQRHNEKQRAYLQLSDRRMNLLNRLSGSVTVKSIFPDTLYFPFALRADKPLPVSVRQSISFKPGFGATGEMIIEPGRVKVSGREALIDTLQMAYTELWVAEHVDDTLQARLQMARPDSTLRFDPAEVHVLLPVEEFTEVEYTVPLQAVGLPDSLRLRLFPAEVKAICRVPLSRYEEISADDFTATVEYEQVHRTTGDRVRPSWTLVPEAANLVRTEPERVEFLIVQR